MPPSNAEALKFWLKLIGDDRPLIPAPVSVTAPVSKALIVASAVSRFSTLIVAVIGSLIRMSIEVSVPSAGLNWGTDCVALQLVFFWVNVAVSVSVVGVVLIRELVENA